MTQAVDISGRWRGYYEQDGGQHGISMKVAQRGQGFVGQMRDQDTLLSGAAEVQGVDEAGDDDVAVAVEQMSVLPEFSLVEGDVDGARVVFDKRYQGTHSITAWVDEDVEARFDIFGHTVRYEGELDARGEQLRGAWRIAGDSAAGTAGATGTFVLVRQ